MNARFSLEPATLIIAAMLLLAFPLFSHAQVGLGELGSDLTLRATPSTPGPGQIVQLSVQSVIFDLTTSHITWYANDTVLAEGMGVSTATLVAGPIGSETTVRVEITRQDVSASTEGVIRPTQVDLIWEAVSYVPPFYKGRALPSAGTSVRLFAIPRFQFSGSQIPPGELHYTWKQNGKTIPSASGLGRNSALLNGPVLFGTDTISVDVRSANNELTGSASVRISSVEPKIKLYEEHPIFGILYNRAFGSQVSIPETEATFVAVPYFAPARSPDDRLLVYRWRVNNTTVPNNPTTPSTITLNATGSNGQASMELGLTHATNFFMSVADKWNISFSAATTGAFGVPDPFGTSNQ